MRPANCYKVHNHLPPQCFFQDLGQGGAKRQYVIWWGGMALNMHSTCQFQGGARVSLGGQMLPPAPPLKETLLQYLHFLVHMYYRYLCRYPCLEYYSVLNWTSRLCIYSWCKPRHTYPLVEGLFILSLTTTLMHSVPTLYFITL